MRIYVNRKELTEILQESTTGVWSGEAKKDRVRIFTADDTTKFIKYKIVLNRYNIRTAQPLQWPTFHADMGRAGRFSRCSL